MLHTILLMRVQSGNCLSWHAVTLNHYLLLDGLCQYPGGILNSDEIWLLSAIPNNIKPIALTMTVRLQPLVRGQFDKFAFSSTRFDLDTANLSCEGMGTADVEAAPVVVLADIFRFPPLLRLVFHHVVHADAFNFIVTHQFAGGNGTLLL